MTESAIPPRDDDTGQFSVAAEYFETRYREDPDPWGFDSRWYEKRKYALTMAVLAKPRYRRAVEPGCANGALTERLATRCDEVVAFDCVESSVDRAASRLRDANHVIVRNENFPSWWPPGTGDLVVWSEIVYYLTAEGLAEAEEGLRRWLSPGGEVVAVHYTGSTDHPRSARSVTQWLDGLPFLRRSVSVSDECFEAGTWIRHAHIASDPRNERITNGTEGYSWSDNTERSPIVSTYDLTDDSTTDVAAEKASELATSTRQRAAEVADEATSHARRLVDETRRTGRAQADEQAERLASSARTMSSDFRSMANASTGPVGGLLEQGADTIDDVVAKFERDGIDGLAREIGQMARRRPVAFLGATFAAGLAAGRLLRNTDTDELKSSLTDEFGGDETNTLRSMPADAPALDPLPPATTPTPTTPSTTIVAETNR